MTIPTQPTTARSAHQPLPPTPTGAPSGASIGSALRRELGATQVRDRAIDLARMSHDASHYLLRPAAVVIARDGHDVAATIRVATRHGVPVTFRSGGTSLSGQAVTDGVLIDTRAHFRDVEVLADGALVRCRPGATVRAVNTRLAPYRRALGPDPASEAACTIGGVVADNSSGMACGTTANTYRTLESIQVVLVDGTLVDTGLPDADARLRAAAPALWEGLARLRDRVRGNPESLRRIAHQFSMKNTMGYGVNAFVDHDSPAEILAHLMVGSEGTLGFITSATFRTVPVYPQVSTALLVFDRISSATAALPDLVAAGTRTAELMDAASLRVAQGLPQLVPALSGLHVRDHTALLIEAQEEDQASLAARVADLDRVLTGLPGLATRPSFVSDAAARAVAWSVRKGLYTAVAGARPVGSTALLEDVVVPMPALTDTVARLQELCNRFGYPDAVIFGHAKDANLHFMINPDLRDPAQLETYATFSDDLVDLILAADGSLKAEHGTGRIMAPYVQRQYGAELYAVMREVKDLFDPGRVLNPGVIISDDPTIHLRDVKVAHPVDPAVDRCVECGYCEPVCPSKDLTTTPRQRIALLRDRAAADEATRAAIDADFSYDVVQTCAADSLCVLACPVGIDTGVVMKGLRAEGHGPAVQRVAAQLADHWGPALRGLRAGVGLAGLVPPAALTAMTSLGRRVVSPDLLPAVGDDLPGPGVSRRTSARRDPAEVVFFPSCITELFGPADGRPRALATAPQLGAEPRAGATLRGGAAFALLRLCDRAGISVRLPEGVDGLCCGTVWRSKGLTQGAAQMAVRTATALLAAVGEDGVPVVTDASSCTHGLHRLHDDLVDAGHDDLAARVSTLTIIDATRFVHETVLPRLSVRKVPSVVIHPTCSDRHAGDVPHLVALAEACAELVDVPMDAGCCAFAGDRGMLHPELTASATRAEAAEVRHSSYDAYLSTNRTCELGMTRATGHPYRHVLELLDELSG